jgi:hypothetical protein
VINGDQRKADPADLGACLPISSLPISKCVPTTAFFGTESSPISPAAVGLARTQNAEPGKPRFWEIISQMQRPKERLSLPPLRLVYKPDLPRNLAMAPEEIPRSSEVVLRIVVTNPDPDLQYPERHIKLRAGCTVTIGRTSKRSPDFTADMTNARFDNPVMSRDHALLTVDDESTVYLEDLKSLHGTTINDHQLPSKRRHRVSFGDYVQFGKPIIHGTDTYQPLCAHLYTIISNPEYDNSNRGFRVPDDPPSSIDNDGFDSDADLSNAAKRMYHRGIRWNAREDRKAIRQAVVRETVDLTGDDFDTCPEPTVQDDEPIFLSERPAMRITNQCPDTRTTTTYAVPTYEATSLRTPFSCVKRYQFKHCNSAAYLYGGEVCSDEFDGDEMDGPGVNSKEAEAKYNDSDNIETDNVIKVMGESEITRYDAGIPAISGNGNGSMKVDKVEKIVEKENNVLRRQSVDNFFSICLSRDSKPDDPNTGCSDGASSSATIGEKGDSAKSDATSSRTQDLQDMMAWPSNVSGLATEGDNLVDLMDSSDASGSSDNDEGPLDDASVVDSDDDESAALLNDILMDHEDEESQLSDTSVVDPDDEFQGECEADLDYRRYMEYKYVDSDDEMDDGDMDASPAPLDNQEAIRSALEQRAQQFEEDGISANPQDVIAPECVTDMATGIASSDQVLQQPENISAPVSNEPKVDEISAPSSNKRKADDISSCTWEEESAMDAHKRDDAVDNVSHLPASTNNELAQLVLAESSGLASVPETSSPIAPSDVYEAPLSPATKTLCNVSDAPSSSEILTEAESATAAPDVVVATAEPPRKRLRRMAEALGCVAIGGAALFSTLVATAPNL